MITKQSTLQQLQAYVASTELRRNFHSQSSIEKCLLLGEEVGELFKAVRRSSGLSTDPNSELNEVGNELADVLNYLLSIANRHQIDLGQAFVEKEKINDSRIWERSPDR